MQVVPNYWAKKCTEGSVPLCTLRAIVAVRLDISFYKIDLKALDKAYSIAFPGSTAINKSKKKLVISNE